LPGLKHFQPDNEHERYIKTGIVSSDHDLESILAKSSPTIISNIAKGLAYSNRVKLLKSISTRHINIDDLLFYSGAGSGDDSCIYLLSISINRDRYYYMYGLINNIHRKLSTSETSYILRHFNAFDLASMLKFGGCNIDTLRSLLSKIKPDENLLGLSIEYGDFDIFKLILSGIPKPDLNEALEVAIINRNHYLVKWLISKGAVISDMCRLTDDVRLRDILLLYAKNSHC
jgi:hypothetical protein